MLHSSSPTLVKACLKVAATVIGRVTWVRRHSEEQGSVLSHVKAEEDAMLSIMSKVMPWENRGIICWEGEEVGGEILQRWSVRACDVHS